VVEAWVVVVRVAGAPEEEVMAEVAMVVVELVAMSVMEVEGKVAATVVATEVVEKGEEVQGVVTVVEWVEEVVERVAQAVAVEFGAALAVADCKAQNRLRRGDYDQALLGRFQCK